MTITFFSIFLNDHQLPLCKAFISLIGEDNFRFVAHERIDPERVAMGFKDINNLYPFVVKSYETIALEKEAQKLMRQSDIVIIGSYRNMPFEDRIESNKITFRYNERILKNGLCHWFDPRVQIMIYKQWSKYRHKNLYTLCASAYTSKDLSLFGYQKSKCFKWGYFPVVNTYNNTDHFFQNKKASNKASSCVTILWVGRLIKFKHPEYSIEIARMLKEDGYRYSLNIIGIGEEQQNLENLIRRYHLESNVSFLGAMPPEVVRKHMEESSIYLFTSDKAEGWGAVLNESMNSGCAVVANKSIGSVPFMIEDGINGLIYKDSLEQAYSQVKRLFHEDGLIESIGRKGIETMTSLWNAKVAAKRFITLANCLMAGEISPFKSGPCSPA